MKKRMSWQKIKFTSSPGSRHDIFGVKFIKFRAADRLLKVIKVMHHVSEVCWKGGHDIG